MLVCVCLSEKVWSLVGQGWVGMLKKVIDVWQTVTKPLDSTFFGTSVFNVYIN